MQRVVVCQAGVEGWADDLKGEGWWWWGGGGWGAGRGWRCCDEGFRGWFGLGGEEGGGEGVECFGLFAVLAGGDVGDGDGRGVVLDVVL